MPIVSTAFSGSEQLDGIPNATVVRSLDPAALADAIIKAAGMPRVTPPDTLTANDLQKLIDL